MPKTNFHDYVVKDLMAGIPGIHSRAMFGGFGLYKNGQIFGIIVDDEVYFKVGDANRKDYERKGSEPFTYKAKGNKRVTMSYWHLPAEILDDGEVLAEWVERSRQISGKNAKIRSSQKKAARL